MEAPIYQYHSYDHFRDQLLRAFLFPAVASAAAAAAASVTAYTHRGAVKLFICYKEGKSNYI